MKKLAVHFISYDKDGYEYSRRFAFMERRGVFKEAYRLFNESEEVVKVKAIDHDTGKAISQYPSAKGGARPNSGRKPSDGLDRPCHVRIVVEREVRAYLETKDNISAFVNALIRAYMKNTEAAAEATTKAIVGERTEANTENTI